MEAEEQEELRQISPKERELQRQLELEKLKIDSLE